MAKSKIPWTDKSWNPVVGCTKVSAGCQNCYAERLHTQRHKAYHEGKKMPEQYAKPFCEVQLLADRLDAPLHWRNPCKVFVNSMSDLFHKDVPFSFIGQVYGMIAGCSEHTFQILTKRLSRVLEFYKWLKETQWPKMWPPIGDTGAPMDANVVVQFVEGAHFDGNCPICKRLLCRFMGDYDAPEWPLQNLWLGVSVENQKNLDRYYDFVSSDIPAAKVFVSFEPLLTPIETHFRTTLLRKPDWAIVGCESINGKPGRFCEDEAEWWAAARDIYQQVKDFGGKFFMKQGPINGKVVKKIEQFPTDLQIQDYPE